MARFFSYIFITLFFYVINNTKAQGQTVVQMDSVHNLILKINTDLVFKDCDLHYTIIKMEVNKNNRVTSVTSLNSISERFMALFKPLERMDFPKEKNAKKTIIFIYVVYPSWECKPPADVPDKTTLHTFLPKIASLLVKQIKENPKTVYYEPIFYGFQGEILENRTGPKK